MKPRQLSFEAIGTLWSVSVQADIADSSWQEITAAIHDRIDEFDKTYSRFRVDSLVTKMSQKGGTYQLPPDAYPMLNYYEQLYRATVGSVTPLIGQVISDAGYDANYSLKPRPLQQPAAWSDIISYNKQSVTLSQPALLDFGAAGKGYLVDIVSSLLSRAGLYDYFINAGGDILQRTSTQTSLAIGLENPLDTSEVIGVATIHNQSLCASSGRRRSWGKYHHIIDPRSLESPQEIIATWVIADDTIIADGLATALFFSEASKLQRQFQFSYALLRRDMSLEYAKDFPVEIYQEAV